MILQKIRRIFPTTRTPFQGKFNVVNRSTYSLIYSYGLYISVFSTEEFVWSQTTIVQSSSRTSVILVQTLHSFEVWPIFSTIYNQPNKTRSRNNSLIGPVDETVLADCGEINLKGGRSGNNENFGF